MNSLSVILAVILVVLIYIAVILGIIARELTRRIHPGFKDTDLHESPIGGQTINVNLSQSPNASSLTTSVDKVIKLDSGQNASGNAATEREADAVPDRLVAKPVPSAPFAVKCPKCQAENSSYRSECFNCGSSL